MKKTYFAHMIRFLFSLLMLSSIFVTTGSVASMHMEGVPYKKIVFFGDSLTDTGNLYRYDLGFLPKSPPYFEGRFSNGLVWTDYMKNYLQAKNIEILNYAVGGETVLLHNPIDGFFPYTLSISVNNYLSKNKNHADHLFIIWIGSNDYLYNFKDANEISSNVIEKIKSSMEKLISHGAKHFIVINIPNLAKIPYVIDLPYKDKIAAAVILHNEKLSHMLMELNTSFKNVNITSFDANKFFHNFTTHTEDYNQKYGTHISELNTACWTGGYTLQNLIEADLKNYLKEQKILRSQMEITKISEHINHSPLLLETYKIQNNLKNKGKQCKNPDDYMFWDTLHPTGAMHKIMSQVFIEYFEKNNI